MLLKYGTGYEVCAMAVHHMQLHISGEARSQTV